MTDSVTRRFTCRLRVPISLFVVVVSGCGDGSTSLEHTESTIVTDDHDRHPAKTDAGTHDASAVGTEGIERDVLRPESRTPTAELIASLKLPAGFQVGVFARDLGHARMLAVHEKHVYLTRPMQGDVLLLVDHDGDGQADQQTTVAADLPMVHGIAIHEHHVYLATPTHVYR